MMSATDDINSKEEDDLLNKDLEQLNTRNASDNKTSSEASSTTPDDSENSSKMTDEATLELSENSNNESGYKITSIPENSAQVADEATLGLSENSNNESGDKLMTTLESNSGKMTDEATFGLSENSNNESGVKIMSILENAEKMTDEATLLVSENSNHEFGDKIMSTLENSSKMTDEAMLDLSENSNNESGDKILSTQENSTKIADKAMLDLSENSNNESGDKITSIPENSAKITNEATLELSINSNNESGDKIMSIPENSAMMTDEATFGLSENSTNESGDKIMSTQENSTKITDEAMLDLSEKSNNESGDKITSIPENSANMTNEATVELSKNSNNESGDKITSIPENSAKMTNEATVELSKNSNNESGDKIMSIPDNSAMTTDEATFGLLENSNNESGDKIMSTLENSTKMTDEANLRLSENSDNESGDKIMSIPENSAMMTDAATFGLSENSNNESGDKIMSTQENSTKITDEAMLDLSENSNNESGDKITSISENSAKMADEANSGLSENSNNESGDKNSSIVENSAMITNEATFGLSDNSNNESGDEIMSTLENSTKMTDKVMLGLSENINNESGDKITSILDKSSVESVDEFTVKPLVLETGENSGDNAPANETAITMDMSTHERPLSALEVASIVINDSKLGIERETVKRDLDDEMFSEEDLKLRWDDDDEISTTQDNETESCDAPKSIVTEKILENSELDLQKIVDNTSTSETQSVSKSNVQIIESIPDPVILEVNKKEDAELFEEKNHSEQPPENHSINVLKEYSEDELLKDADTEMMEVDMPDENVTILKTTEGIVKTSDDSTKIQENTMQENKSKEPKVDDKPIESDIIDDDINKTSAASHKIPKSTADQKILTELILSMDVDSSHISIESSPIGMKTRHGLRKPDVMLEIPTEELIYMHDALDRAENSKNDEGITMANQEMIYIHDALDKAPYESMTITDDCQVYEDTADDNLADRSVNAVSVTKEQKDGTTIENMEDNQDVTGDSKNKETSDNVTDLGGEGNKDLIGGTVNVNIEDETAIGDIKRTEASDDVTVAGEEELKEADLGAESSQLLAEVIPTKASITVEPQPSTSTDLENMTSDTLDEVSDMNDSLGLLAESSRVMDDDDYQDDDDDGDADDDGDGDDDGDDDYDQDEDGQQSENEPGGNEMKRDLEDREAVETRDDIQDRQTESNTCEEDFDIDEVEMEDDDTVGMEAEESRDSNEKNEDRELLLSEIKAVEKKEKEDETQPKDTVEKAKDNTVQSRDAVQKKRGDLIPLKDTEKKTEGTIKLEEKTTIKEEAKSVADAKRRISLAGSDDSADDCIEQPIEIETVKVSDDDDENDEPSKATQEEINNAAMTKLLEKYLLDKEAAFEKITLSDKITTVEKPSRSEKASVTESVSELEKVTTLEKQSETEKKAEEDMATIDLTPPDQPSTEEPQTVAIGTPAKCSPNKLKNLTVTTVLNTNILSIVDLEESSSEDDIQEVVKEPDHAITQLQRLLQSAAIPPKIPESLSIPPKTVESSSVLPKTVESSSVLPKTVESTPIPPSKDMTSVNIPTGIDIMSTSSAGGRSQIVTKEKEVVISGLSKPPPHKPARLNTSEVTIKTASSSEQTLVIPEAKAQEQVTPAVTKPKIGLEIFSLDSDEDDAPPEVETTTPSEADTEPPEPKKKKRKCINSACRSELGLRAASPAAAAHYDASRKKRPVVCQTCADALLARKQSLIDGIKNLTPLLRLDMSTTAQDLVEILDSESEDDDLQPHDQQPRDTIGEEAAKFLEENLTDLLNDTWKKYKFDDRLKETQDELDAEILKLDEESKEINQMLVDCQTATDKLRSDLYATFELDIEELPPLAIFETPDFNYIGPEADMSLPAAVEARFGVKRKLDSNNEPQAKRPAIPLGYAPLDDSKAKENKPVDNKAEEDKDISVVKLSAESAPADLPPPGELKRPPLRVGMAVFAMKNAFGPWFKGKVTELMPKSSNPGNFTTCRIKFDHKQKTNGKMLPARCIAYAEPADVRMTIGTRVIALFKDLNKSESFYSGVIAEIPNPVNNYRYLVFFDDGYAQYVGHSFTRLVCECSPLVWEEVHPLSREFVREYLMAYPERPMVRLHEGQHLKTEWDGKWRSSLVRKVDASLAQVEFLEDGRREWVYRGSTRLAPLFLELQAAERTRKRPLPRNPQPQANMMMPYVEYIRSEDQANKTQTKQPGPVPLTTEQQIAQRTRHLRSVAKKSTSVVAPTGPLIPYGPAGEPGPTGQNDTVTSRVVFYTPRNVIRPLKLVPHECSPKCKRNDLLTLKELRSYNPLARPLLSGWERQTVRYKGHKEVMYRGPCGRRLRNMKELHRYLRLTESELPVDLFDFFHGTHCLSEYTINGMTAWKKDLSHGKENMPIPAVNIHDSSLPYFCSYNTERTPTTGVPLNLDPGFLCGCDCTDDCEDKSKCACWKMTLEGARTIGLHGADVGYEYRRLPDPLPSGIYECNVWCKCKQTCLNRVAQHPLQLKLQVFKTLNRGWGIRALNDVPKGAFLCVYAGNLLTDQVANTDGLQEGDEYLAELDYIEVVEQLKEGYEEEALEAEKKRITKEGIKKEDESGEELSSSSEEEENASKTDKEDDDFRPGFFSLGVADFNKRLRKRSKNKKDQKDREDGKNGTDGKDGNDEKDKDKEGKTSERNADEDCITISDDEEGTVRQPSRFTAKPDMVGTDFIPKYGSVRALFGPEESVYIMDAKVQGNIGRYLNHSCSPNVFVQNVFVDTHDPRFPWVAFFANSHVKAGTELTWNYNYDIGSVQGKVLYCYCEAINCRGRLL